MVKEGRVLRSYSGYYYVACGDTVYTCKVRGHMKKERFSLCTGDLVRFDAADVPSGEAAKGMIAGGFRRLPKSILSDFSIALRDRDGHIVLAKKCGQFLLGQIHVSESCVCP